MGYTIDLTVQRHMMEVRAHLLRKVVHRARLAFGESVEARASNDHPSLSLFKSAKVAGLLATISPVRIPRLHVCTYPLGSSWPFELDTKLGLGEGARNLITYAGSYPLNAVIGVERELRHVFVVDTVTGCVVAGFGVILLGVPLWSSMVQATSRRDAATSLFWIVVPFPFYFAALIATVDMLRQTLTSIIGQVLALIAIPMFAGFVFLFPKILATLRWLYGRLRARRGNT